VALIAGQLLLDQHPEVEEHLAECSNCQNIVAAAAAGLADSQDEPPSSRDKLPKSGDVVAGKYRIEKVIGRGGMGTVFAARHDELGQTVAIKMLHSAAPTASARFQREAQISAQLLSEHTARVFDLGTSDGVPFLVMEYLAGEDLASVISRGSVSPEVAVDYALQICKALEEAHESGVVHRDLKPGNVFVVQRTDGSSCVKILDFGISKRLLRGKAEKSHDLTNAHAVLGSPAYMSPEQLRQSNGVDARTDIWSLGVLLYELLTRTRPFQSWSLAGLSAAIAADSPRPPSRVNPAVPAALDRVVMRCLRKEPSERFASVVAVSEALRHALPRFKRPALRGWLIASGGMALATAAFVTYANRHLEEAHMPVLAQPPPGASPSLAVHCDPPYPQGNFRFLASDASPFPALDRPWPIVALCAESGSAAIRAELGAALAPPFALARAELEPAHPCYQLDVRSDPGELSLDLARKDRCTLRVQLRGASCEQVQTIEVSGDGISRVMVSPGSSGAGSSGEMPAADSGCQREIELPFQAYGKRLAVHLHPEPLSAPDTVFSSALVELEVRRPRKPRQRQVMRDAPPPCVPPNYCRN
jgi:eukaryotic-like serine/threonine-protein kinase